MIFTDYIKRSAWGALLLSLFILLAFRVIFLFVNQPENNTVVLLLTVIPVLATGIILTLFCDTYGLLPDRTRWILVTYAWLVAVSPCSYDKWQAVVAGVFVTGALYRLAAGLMSNWAVPILSLELSILLVRDCCSVRLFYYICL